MDHYAQVNHIQLHYLDYPGAAPPLILMPGLTVNARSFDGLIAAGLSPALRVVAVDLRGRGLSDKPATGYTMEDHARDIIGLLDHLELAQVVMGGHSFGGLLTLYLAANYPDRISKAVVIDAAGEMHPDTLELIKPSVDRLGQTVPSWEQYLETMKSMPFFDGWWDPLIENFYRADVETLADGSVKPRSRPEAIIEAVEAGLGEDWNRHLANIKQPLLLLNAPGPFGPPGTPPVLPRENALATVNAVANGRYVEIPGNHWTMVFGDSARIMVEAITAFVHESP
jgi:pimeloyl-ACP methyl ester carboxylesterase